METERAQELWERIEEVKAEIEGLPALERKEIEGPSILRDVSLNCWIGERIFTSMGDPVLRIFQVQFEEAKKAFQDRRKNLGARLLEAERKLKGLNEALIDETIKKWRISLAELPKIDREVNGRGYDIARGAPLTKLKTNEDQVMAARKLLIEAIPTLEKMGARSRNEIIDFIERTRVAIEASDFSPKEKLVDELYIHRQAFIEKGLEP